MESKGDMMASAYLESSIDLRRRFANEPYAEQDSLWLENYDAVSERMSDVQNLPRMLALIHPDFYYHRSRSFRDNLPWEMTSEFRAGITRVDKCEAIAYTGVECIANKHPKIRGKCQADHRWPNSLGGPSVVENRLLLCKFHNGMKSNDVTRFDWTKIPNWLVGYLQKIARLKR